MLKVVSIMLYFMVFLFSSHLCVHHSGVSQGIESSKCTPSKCTNCAKKPGQVCRVVPGHTMCAMCTIYKVPCSFAPTAVIEDAGKAPEEAPYYREKEKKPRKSRKKKANAEVEESTSVSSGEEEEGLESDDVASSERSDDRVLARSAESNANLGLVESASDNKVYYRAALSKKKGSKYHILWLNPGEVTPMALCSGGRCVHTLRASMVPVSDPPLPQKSHWCGKCVVRRVELGF